MKKKKILAVILGGMLSFSVILPGFAAISKMPVDSGLVVKATNTASIDFNYVKAHSKEQSFYSNEKGGAFKMYVTTLHINPLNKVKEVAVYGKFDIPLMSQDVGIEEFESKLMLPNDDNYVVFNDVVKSFLIWAPEDPNQKYEKQIFKHDGNLHIRGNSLKLTIAGEEFTVKVPETSSVIDASFLDEAITEHWGNYMAAVNAGLEIKEDGKKAYLAKNDEARALVEKVNKGESVKQEDVDKMRDELNIAFSDMVPMPFDKSGLEAQIKIADKKLDQNGKNGERYTKETYDAFMKSYGNAKDLMDKKDLNGIVTSKEGEPIKTHRDFKNAEKDLAEKIDALKLEKYTQADSSKLESLYYEAVEKMPKEGFGYTDESRVAFYDEIDKVANLLVLNKVYATQEEFDNAKTSLDNAMKNLVETELDKNVKFKIHVKYMHQMKDSVSALIKEYFKDEKGNDIEAEFEVVKGQEVRIPLSSDIIKKFDGYHPSSFHYKSDDGTLKLVRVLRDKDGKQYIVFKADTSNLEVGAPLAIFYEEGNLDMPQDDSMKVNTETMKSENNSVKSKDVENKAKKDKEMTPKTGDQSAPFVAGALALLAGGCGLALRKREK